MKFFCGKLNILLFGLVSVMAIKILFTTILESEKLHNLQYQEILDIGFAESDAIVDLEIPIQNLTQKIVHVFNFHTTCGCIRIKKKTSNGIENLLQSEAIEPGNSLVLMLSIRAASGLDQRVFQSVFFNSDSNTNSDHRITIHGKIRYGFFILPSSLYLSGLSNTTTNFSFDVIDAREQSQNQMDLEFSFDSAMFKFISYSKLSSTEISDTCTSIPDGCAAYRVHFTTKIPSSTFHDTIRVHSNNSNVSTSISVTISPIDEIRLLPSLLVFQLSTDESNRKVFVHGRDILSIVITDKPEWLLAELRENIISFSINLKYQDKLETRSDITPVSILVNRKDGTQVHASLPIRIIKD